MAASPSVAHHTSSESSTGSPAGRHRCDRCASSFVRLEHLKRHQRDHWESKPFVCTLCGKGFTRSDTLKRHETVHAAMAAAGTGDQQFDLTQTRSRRGPRVRACRNCAQARARCSGDDVCVRCASKALVCEYPEKRRKTSEDSFVREDVAAPIQPPPPQQHDQHQQHQLQSVSDPSVPQWGFGSAGLPPDDFSKLPDAASFQNSALASAPYQAANGLQNPGPGSAQRVPTDSLQANAPLPLGPHADQTSPMQGPNAAPMASVARNYQPQPPSDLGMNLDAVYDPSMYSINWIPTAFNDDFDYAAFSSFGMPLQAPGFNASFSGFMPDGGAAAQMPLDMPALSTPREHHDSPRETSSTQTSSSDSTGRLYATSVDGARMPFVTQGKRRSFNVPSADHIRSSFAKDPQRGLAFPQAPLPVDDVCARPGATPQLAAGAYDRIAAAFERVCLALAAPFTPFASQHLPSPDHFDYFVQLFFEHFHPILPILHPQTLRLDEENWLLALAVAAVGCRYSDSEELLEAALPMVEFARRAVLVEVEQHAPQKRSLQLLQAMLLNEIGMLYSGSPRLLDAGQREHGRLVEAVRNWDVLAPADSEAISWSHWTKLEGKNRLAYAIWLLDCMSAYHQDQKPFLSLEDMQGRLPCHEELWDAESEEEWKKLCPKIEANPTITEAMHRLYVNKKVKPDIGEFSRVLLIHGIYHETWAVARYHRRSLASWIPSAEKPLPENNSVDGAHRRGSISDRSLYLPENPLYSKWRNAACDCLDVLHWAANATIAQQSGSEHATVFHLHASRTILLSPFAEIAALARSMASWATNNKVDAGQQTQSLPELTRLEGKVFQWVQKDQHKARLCMIHAGALYWHVRRFSRAAFYEPNAVFLSTLAMWAYASYTALATRALASSASASAAAATSAPHNNHRDTSGSQSGSPSPEPEQHHHHQQNHQLQNHQQHHHHDGISPSAHSTMSLGTTSDDPTFIRLDRPNDDEMVQLYVRNGHPSRMKANVTGVGNLSAPLGPERILREGCKILAPMALTWGVAHEYVRVLSAMAEVVVGVRERGEGGGSGAGAAVGGGV